MKTILIVLSLILIPSLARPQGIAQRFDVRLTSPKLVEVEPGQIVTGSYLISNRARDPVELRESLHLPKIPQKWEPVVTYEHSLRLERTQERVRLITFRVPEKCPPGTYEVVYFVGEQGFADFGVRASFSVVVLPVVKLDAVVEDKPDTVRAGDEYDVRLRLVNGGNSPASMKVVVKGSPDFPVIVEPAETVVEAGSSKLVNLFVATDATQRSESSHVLEINASAAVPDRDVVSAKRSVFVRILPAILEVVDPRHKVPSRVRFIAVGDEEQDGFQMEYAGSGSLDEGGARTVDFLFRGPDVQDRSAYGIRDVLRFGYTDRTIDLHLGDRSFVLSPLSERYTYGRGAEARVRPGDFEIGSFFMKTRWNAPEIEETGAHIGYVSKRTFKIRGNYLKKKQTGDTSDTFDSNIYTIQARVNPSNAFNLGVEYGYSVNRGIVESKDPAHRLTLDGQLSSRVWYTFENTYARPAFLGYYRDALYSSGTVAASIYRGLRGNLSYRIHESNLELDPAKDTAPRERSLRGELSHSFRWGTNISLGYKALSRKDEMPAQQFDYNEDVITFGLGQSRKRYSLQTLMEKALFDDHVIGGPARNLERYSVYAYLRPTAAQSYSIFTRFGHNSFTGTPERTASIGFNASLKVKSFLKLGLSYQRSNITGRELPYQDFLFTTLDFQLPNKHTLSLKGRWIELEGVDRQDYSFFAAYTIPLAVPVMRKESVGMLRGRIIDNDNVGARRLKNVVLSAGDVTATTDETGEYVFPALKPGRYPLQIDQNSIGFEKIATDPLPTVEIKGGKTTFREINIATECKFSGRVVRMGVGPGAPSDKEQTPKESGLFVTTNGELRSTPLRKEDLKEMSGLSHISVVISKGDEVLHQKTDDKGAFSFDGIRPGKWQLRVYDKGLPRNHYFEKAVFDFELIGGDKKEISVRVLPRIRSIRMIDGKKIK